MASRNRQYLTIRDLRGGFNDTDPPTLLGENECIEAVNVDWQAGGIAHRRNGSEVVTLLPTHSFTNHLATIYRHVSAGGPTKAELWGVDADSVVNRWTASDGWLPVATPDALSDPQHVVFCTFGGFLYIAYNSPVDRLHMGGVVGGQFTLIRVGLPTPGAPTIGAKSAGAVTDTRTYKVGWNATDGNGIVTNRSELSLPSAPPTVLAAQQVIVNRPAVPPTSENATSWDLYAAGVDGVYYGPLATAPLATASLIDNVATLNTLPVAPLVGANIPPPSCKYLITDGNRLIMAGAWESQPNAPLSSGLTSRVWFTPVLGLVRGESERIPQIANVQNNYLDITEKDGDEITGLAQLLGMVYVFKRQQLWKLVPTGIDTSPYFRVQVSRDIGTISHKSICVGEDADGNPSLYFLSREGPYRLGATGLEFLGWKIRRFWETVNLDATEQIAVGVHYSAKQEIWWFLAVDGSNSPNCRLMFDALDGGFAVNRYPNRDPIGTACCLFSETPGLVSSLSLKPYFSLNKGELVLLKGDTGTRDYGEKYQASITTKPYVLETILRETSAWEGRILAVAALTEVQLTLIRDFGLESHEELIDLTPQLAETRVIRRFEASYLSGNRALQVTLGDPGNVDAEWTLDELVLPVQAHQED